MKKTFVTMLALVSACATSAAAENLDGSVSIGARYSNLHGQTAKATEYRTLGSGGAAGLDLSYRDLSKYLDLDASIMIDNGKAVDAGTASDNNLLIRGGLTDLYKFSLFYNETPHNLTYGARTYFTGIGSNALSSTLTAPTTTTAFNNSFDYAIKRTNFGAETELSLKTPFFFLARVDRTNTQGTQPVSISMPSARELPAPVDYTTDNLYLQTGYRSKRVIATVDGTISSFTNNYNTMTVQQGALLTTTVPNTVYLPPDNRFYKIGGSIMYKVPVWTTTVMARGNHSIMESNPFINEQYAATSFANLGWNGKITYNTVNASVTSNPVKNLDTRIYYNYLERSNESETLNNAYYYNTTLASPVTKFSFDKQNAGLDLGYKLPYATKVSAGYDYAKTNRSPFFTNVINVTSSSPHADRTTDHLFYLQAKNSFLDVISGKLRYEHLMRSSDYDNLAYQLATTTAANLRRAMFRPAEDARKDMDAIKAELEIEPMHGLSFGLQYALKFNKYPDSPTGVQDDKRHEFFADATYSTALGKLNIYGELETVETNTEFYGSGTGGTWAGLTNTYIVNSKRNDLNYAAGSKIDANIFKDIVTASLGYRFENADGSNDFSTAARGTLDAATLTTVGNIVNIDALDDYRKHCINASLMYKATEAVTVSLSYLYENLRYSDDAYAGYVNVPRGTTYALSGAYNNPSYDASAIYLGMKYKF